MAINSTVNTGVIVQQDDQGPNVMVPSQSITSLMISIGAQLDLLNVKAIVGTASDVTNYLATHSSLQGAINATVAGDTILVRNVSITENITLATRRNIVGAGYESFINGTFTGSSGCTYTTIKRIRFGNTVTLNSGANGNIITDCFFFNQPVDNGIGNLVNGVEV